MLRWIQGYFRWLQNEAPAGGVEVLPLLSPKFESSVPGIYVIGDLTGIPLLKYAVASGKEVWQYITNKIESEATSTYDAVIIGAGPSGISCAIEAKRLGRNVVVLESNDAFQTINSYPKGKPIFAEPDSLFVDSPLQIENGTKESLLDSLSKSLSKAKINLIKNARVSSIKSLTESYGFAVTTESGTLYNTKNVIIAMGKSGDPKKLGVTGENLEHVFYRLLDPASSTDKEVMVVGGGDSAVEAAIAISKYAKRTTLVHRGESLSRPKAQNLNQLHQLVKSENIEILLETQVDSITTKEVILRDKKAAKKRKVDALYILVGSDPPVSFLKKVGIRLQNVRNLSDWVGFFTFISFAMAAYFGKASFYLPAWYGYVATISAIFCVIGTFTWIGMTNYKRRFQLPSSWIFFRNIYLSLVPMYFLSVYFLSAYKGFHLFGKLPSFHYTLIYSLTILFFGIRRIFIRRTKYIFWQTFTLIFVQVVFLFLLPEIVLPYLGKIQALGPSDGFFRTQVFPNDAYWKAYGFILAWPLSMGVLYDGNLTMFWLIYGLCFTFGFIPMLVYYFGKGAYCGWICSCGGLAETLGDEHRAKMPHSKLAYKIEHSGQWILLVAFVLTILKLVGVFGKNVVPFLVTFESTADSIKWIYDLIVDIGLAGVMGVGCYFFLSGRIWCRMFCPLASLMHIYAKFSKFRIFSDKKKCISCNICTANCHQGIDVMSYANQGRPMDSVQCVRCSACVSLCPTKVLTFGMVE